MGNFGFIKMLMQNMNVNFEKENQNGLKNIILYILMRKQSIALNTEKNI